MSISTAQYLGHKKLPVPPRAAQAFRDGMAEKSLVPIPELNQWRARQAGRWEWCPHCRVCITPSRLNDHKLIHKERTF